jgi:serine/threonine protein kinase
VKLTLAKKGKVKFKLMETIGSGAQGTVYRAKNGIEQYALKVYNHEDPYSVSAQRRARLVSKLIHSPQTGALSRAWSVDNGQDDEQNPVMLYRLFPNRAIEDYYNAYQRPKQFRIRERLAVGLLAGVVEIHRNHVVHADLAPINVLYSPRGEVAIIDFDGAGYFPRDRTEGHKEPIVKGHIEFPGWVAPHEVSSGHATFGTDIWWTGSILMKVLSNFTPFFFLKVADDSAIKELNDLVPEVTEWPPSYKSIRQHSQYQPNLTPAILDKVRKVLNMTIATKTLGDIFMHHESPDQRPSAIKLWSSFRGRVFR